MKILKSILPLLLFFSINSYAEIYKWTDENGVIHYSENKPAEIVVEELIIKTYESVVIEDNDESSDESSDFTSIEQTKKRIKAGSRKVVMYSAEWCGVCKQAKKYFGKKRIRYTNYDIDKSKSAKARYKKLGATGVPVILVGDRRMNGFSVGGFNQIYKQ